MLIKRKKQKGFSLVELMVVVAIISILAALALPRFQIFQAKARTSEAKANLNMIYTLQQAYHGENDTYIDIDPTGAPAGTRTGNAENVCQNNLLGFSPEPCNSARYRYTIIDASRTEFTATATAPRNEINPACDQSDTWTITHEKVLTNTTNAVACLSDAD